ncbi:hypothetical protein [Exiguobacterium sp. s59]|uniref:hypothetical protein n=1 Tax=Exiguobacterium sp. s59 TaxID=2751269 RepID=UPI001BEC7901|nr:hypothetical protein [Exiguobacterium sp. s59]
MGIQHLYVCTAKNGKLHRFYNLIMGENDKNKIEKYIKTDLDTKKKSEFEMNELSGTALIEDLPYYVDMETVKKESYLYEFKEKINLLNDPKEVPPRVLQLKKRGKNKGDIKNFDDNEVSKFFIIVDEASLYFLQISRNATIQDTPFINMSVTSESKMISVDRGVQFPNIITSRLDLSSNRLYVYDVDRFESMLMQNESRTEKSKKVIEQFKIGKNHISKEKYKVKGLENKEVESMLLNSKRTVRRLSKYQDQKIQFEIAKIVSAVERLPSDKKVDFNHEEKTITVTVESSKTFVGILHNVIVERLISGEVEVIV